MPESRRLQRSWPLVLIAMQLGFCGSAAAQNEIREFFVDPAQSYLQIDSTSQFVFDLPAPLGTLTMPLVAQTDPSTSGLVLPGIGLSDGTITALEGGFFLDLILPTQPGLVGSLNGGEASQLFEVANSGSWLPGSGAAPLPGQLAVEVGFPSLGLSADFVVRDLAFSGFSGGDLNYVSDESWTFPGQPLFLFPEISTLVVDGAVWIRGFGFRGAILMPFRGATLVVPADSGSLTRLGSDDWEISIPFTTSLDVSPAAAFGGGVELDLSGQIVANTVPEPGRALGIGIGLAMLVWLADRRRRRPDTEPDTESRWLVYLTAAFLLGSACTDPVEFLTDADSDGELSLGEVTSVVEGEGNAATASAQQDNGNISIEENGGTPGSASCSAGSCPSPFTFSTPSGCGTVEERVGPDGVEITVVDTCPGTTVYSASMNTTQAAFPMSVVAQTVYVRSRVNASNPAGLGLLALVNFQPLFPNTIRAIVVPPGPALNISVLLDLTYTATDPGDEWVTYAIDVISPSGTCSNDLECGAGAFCYATGVCLASVLDAPCTTHADCPADLSCIAPFNRCRTPSLYPDPCSFDWDCEGTCPNFQCSEGLLGHGCRTDEDCDASAPTCGGGFCGP